GLLCAVLLPLRSSAGDRGQTVAGDAAADRSVDRRKRRGLDGDLVHLRRVEPVAPARLAVAPGRDEGGDQSEMGALVEGVALEDPEVEPGGPVGVAVARRVL